MTACSTAGVPKLRPRAGLFRCNAKFITRIAVFFRGDDAGMGQQGKHNTAERRKGGRVKTVDQLAFMAYGIPGPQGSKRHVGNGVMIESSAKVKPWREAVKWAAVEAGGRVEGPVSVVMSFTLPKPKSAKKMARACKKPDLSKLIRSTEDALTDAGVWEDDARVVNLVAQKWYVGDPEDMVRRPGVFVQITARNEVKP